MKICFTLSKFWSHHQFSRSHRHNFDHTIKLLITLLKICFTPFKFWSHHLFSGSHRHNFVHTIKMLFTLLKICFTPSKFWSHHLKRRMTCRWQEAHDVSLARHAHAHPSLRSLPSGHGEFNIIDTSLTSRWCDPDPNQRPWPRFLPDPYVDWGSQQG